MQILETDGLGRRFGEHTAVDSVSVSLEAGEAFGLLGPNGAGKTTMIKMLRPSCRRHRAAPGWLASISFAAPARCEGLSGMCPNWSQPTAALPAMKTCSSSPSSTIFHDPSVLRA